MNVGDKIEIISWSQIYTTYDEMFKKMKFKNIKLNNPNYKDKEGYIFSIKKHPNDVILIYGIQGKYGQYLMGERGIRLIKNTIYECWI